MPETLGLISAARSAARPTAGSAVLQAGAPRFPGCSAAARLSATAASRIFALAATRISGRPAVRPSTCATAGSAAAALSAARTRARPPPQLSRRYAARTFPRRGLAIPGGCGVKFSALANPRMAAAHVLLMSAADIASAALRRTRFWAHALRSHFFEALQESNRRAHKIKSCAKLIFQESLVAEVQRALLVREYHEPRRRSHGLRDVINFHLVACRRSPAVQIDARKPPVQLSG